MNSEKNFYNVTTQGEVFENNDNNYVPPPEESMSIQAKVDPGHPSPNMSKAQVENLEHKIKKMEEKLKEINEENDKRMEQQ